MSIAIIIGLQIEGNVAVTVFSSHLVHFAESPQDINKQVEIPQQPVAIRTSSIYRSAK